MGKYIALTRYTGKGLAAIADSAERHALQQEAHRRLGITSEHLYLTLGRYDLVHVLDAPDDRAMAELSLQIGSWGWVRLETMPAFSVDEFSDIVSSLDTRDPAVTPYGLDRKAT